MADGEFSGMDELIAGLKALPERLQDEAVEIVTETADRMASELRASYPEHTGNLRSQVRVDKPALLVSRVRATAKHAHLYEYGTVQRHTKSTGANRGTMPARPTFRPAAVRNRRRMVEELTRIVKRTRVPGFDGTAEVRES